MDATRQRQDMARRARVSGLDATMTSGTGGVIDAAPVGRPTLGA
jgi:hypothetical protein